MVGTGHHILKEDPYLEFCGFMARQELAMKKRICIYWVSEYNLPLQLLTFNQ